MKRHFLFITLMILSTFMVSSFGDPGRDHKITITTGTITNLVTMSKDTSKTNFSEKSHKIGETIIVGPLEFTLLEAYEKKDFSEYKKIPEGATYVVVKYKYKNISKEPLSSLFGGVPVHINFEDYNGSIYSTDLDASYYLDIEKDEKIASKLNPGITTKGGTVYEVAIETTKKSGNKLRVNYDYDYYGYYDLDSIWNHSNQYQNNSSYSGNTSSTSLSGLLGSQTSSGLSSNSYSNNTNSEWIFKDSNSRYLTDAEINQLTPYQARLAINEIAARHGRIFKDAEFNDYFSSKSWYVPLLYKEDYDVIVDAILNDYEHVNSERLLARKNGNSLPSLIDLKNKVYLRNISGLYTYEDKKTSGSCYVQVAYLGYGNNYSGTVSFGTGYSYEISSSDGINYYSSDGRLHMFLDEWGLNMNWDDGMKTIFYRH